MRILLIKTVHSVLFFLLSACVLYTLYSGVVGRITVATWIAVLFVACEGIVLIITRWKCPLTTLAERLGAPNGAVADLFLPQWFADRLFLICGVTMVFAVALVMFRWLAA